MGVTFITTVYNEESTIKLLLESLFMQSKFPDEIIIVDGGSTDNTISEISNFQFPISNNKAKIKLIFKKGNRAVGRNEAIKNASNEIVICWDAGCILDRNWVKNITKQFNNLKVDVVAGYYEGFAKTTFQKCLIPYVLVMPDKVNPDNFLPASRSMAFKKSIWKKVGGFPEEFSNNEDYVFAKRLNKIHANIVFEKEAIACWIPRRSLSEAFTMFYRFAKGDAQAKLFRPKVLLIFLRYLIFAGILLISILLRASSMSNLTFIIFIAYIAWSIVKNFKYVNNIAALYYLPVIQIISDFAIILGTIRGIFSLGNDNEQKSF